MISSDSLDDLYPPVRRAAEELLLRMQAKGMDIRISSTYRDAQAQDELYAQGRTKPGLVATNAKGGESAHNYRLAFDVTQNRAGDEYNSCVLRVAGQEAEDMGLTWGNDCREHFDIAHIQWTGGLTLEHLRLGAMPADKPLNWEAER